MNIEEFNKLNLADGQVCGFFSSGEQLCIDCLDWRKEKVTLVFDGFIGVELFDIVGEDLSHVMATDDDMMIPSLSALAKLFKMIFLI
jgi:hypothetical protein